MSHQATLAAVLLELRRLGQEVAELRDEQQHLARRLLSAEDRRELIRLLPLVYVLMGSQVWTAADLYAAALNGLGCAELQALIDEWNTESGGLRSFGRFLERACGFAHAGLRLVATGGRDRSGELYMVMRLSGGPKPAAELVRDLGIADHGPDATTGPSA